MRSEAQGGGGAGAGPGSERRTFPSTRREFARVGLLGGLAGIVASVFAGKARAASPHPPERVPLREVAHRLEIDDLLTRYAIAVDDEQFDLLDTVFTPDALLDYTSGGGPRGYYPEVKEWLRQSLSTGSPARMHMIGNKLVRISGASATVRAWFFNPFAIERVDGGHDYSLGGGHYDHRLILTDAGWRSVEMRMTRVWREGLPARPHPDNARSGVERGSGPSFMPGKTP